MMSARVIRSFLIGWIACMVLLSCNVYGETRVAHLGELYGEVMILPVGEDDWEVLE